MRKRANVFLTVVAIFALFALVPTASFALGDDPAEDAGQEGENRWVPSLAITSGAIMQDQQGSVDSEMLVDQPPFSPLRGFVDGDDFAVSPFVGVALELMTPAIPIPTRPRFFASGEILPTFASDRELAIEGDPDCIRSLEAGATCVVDRDPDEIRDLTFAQSEANGAGSKTTATVDTLVYGANLGLAFPMRIGKRQIRIKPSVGWINYGVDAEGLVVAAACAPPNRCTDLPPQFFIPRPGYVREMRLEASDSRRFNGVGPGLDIEMDTGRFGPLGASLFMGARAYRILGNRKMEFGAVQSYDDLAGNDVAAASFRVEIDQWLFRAHVGLRIQWLGSRK